VNRLTTEETQFMPPTGALTNPVDLFNNDVQTLRYHMMALVPGKWDDILAIGTEDFDYATAVILDLREKEEVYRLPLHHCGNGVLDTDWFEECDYAQGPPVLYADDNTFKYEDTTVEDSIFLLKDDGYYDCDNICL